MAHDREMARKRCDCLQMTDGLGKHSTLTVPSCPQHGTSTAARAARSASAWQTWLVVHLETWCSRLHVLTHHRPWLWLQSLPSGISSTCPLADLSERLDRRWRTGIWS